MNKILMDELYILSNEEESLKIKGNCTIFILDNLSNIKLDIDLTNNSLLNIYDYASNRESMDIKIISNNNTKFYYYHGISISNDYKFKYRNYINGNNNISKLYIHGVSFNNCLIDVDSIVLDNTVNNEVLEEIKMLTDNGYVNVLPKLRVNTSNVFAIHKTAISNIREDIMFYLNSKGIDKEYAKCLIVNSYVYGLFSKREDYIKLIKKER